MQYILRSVGYGDITPCNPSEMRWCTFLLLMGAFLWAYIIGNACGIVSTLDVDNIEHRQRMDQLNIFMEDQGFPMDLRVKLRQFFHESKLMAKEDAYTSLLDRMSPQLEAEERRSLMMRVTNARKQLMMQEREQTQADLDDEARRQFDIDHGLVAAPGAAGGAGVSVPEGPRVRRDPRFF